MILFGVNVIVVDTLRDQDEIGEAEVNRQCNDRWHKTSPDSAWKQLVATRDQN